MRWTWGGTAVPATCRDRPPRPPAIIRAPQQVAATDPDPIAPGRPLGPDRPHRRPGVTESAGLGWLRRQTAKAAISHVGYVNSRVQSLSRSAGMSAHIKSPAQICADRLDLPSMTASSSLIAGSPN